MKISSLGSADAPHSPPEKPWRKRLVNMLFMGATTVTRLLTGLVLFVILARILGATQFGELMYWFTITTLLGLLIDYGYSQKIIFEVSAHPERTEQILGAALVAKLLLCLPVILISLFGFATVWKNRDLSSITVFWILLATAVLNSYAEIFNATMRAHGRFVDEAKITLLVNSMHFLLVTSVAWWSPKPISIAIAWFISRIVFFTLSWLFCARLLTKVLDWQAGLNESVSNLRSGFAFAAESFLTNLHVQIDSLIVGQWLGSGSLGIYQAGLRLMQGANMFAQVVSNVFIPEIARAVGDQTDSRILACSLYRQMLLVGFAMSAPFILFGGSLVKILYGTDYSSLSELMPWFGLLLFVRYLTAAHGVMLSATGLQRYRASAIVIALLVLLASSWMLLPHFGLKGMLAASVLAIIILYGCYALVLWRHKKPLGLNMANVIGGLVPLMLAIAVATGQLHFW